MVLDLHTNTLQDPDADEEKEISILIHSSHMQKKSE